MLRNKSHLIPYLLLASVLVAGLLWHESEQVPRLGRTVVTGQAQIGGPYHLIDQTGAPKSDADFHGRWQLIYFGYSFCPDVCPTTLAVIAQALDKLGGDARRIQPIFITVDPARDTPKVLADYMKAFRPDFIGLTGSAAQIAQVEQAFHVYAKKRPTDPGHPERGYGMDHSSVIYLMGPNGKLVSFYDEAISADDLAKDLKQKI